MTNFPWMHPQQATIKVNRGCNSLCVYCYAWKEKKTRKELSLDKFLHLIDELSELSVQTIAFTGGEPLLRSDIEEMASRAQKSEIRTGVITNGLLLTPERYDALYFAGVRSFSISLDTIEPEIYQHLRGVPLERVLKNILSASKKVQSNDAYITLLCVVNRLNLPTLPELARFAYKNDMRLMLQPVQSVTSHPKDKTDEHLQPWQFGPDDLPWVKEIIQHLMENDYQKAIGNPQDYLQRIPSYLCGDILINGTGCEVGYTDVNIDDNLSLRPCWRLPAVGNLQETSLNVAWTSSAFAASRRNMKEGACPSCWLLYRGRL
jgi:MoaA/NifB/PqqE/SkfB family radical SAM enzyme